MGDGGKGDSPRPFSVNVEQFVSHWESTFGKQPSKFTVVGTCEHCGAKLYADGSIIHESHCVKSE